MVNKRNDSLDSDVERITQQDDSFESDLEIVKTWILEDIEQITLPDSLKGERLLRLLEDTKPAPNRIAFPKRYTRWIGLAACLALALLVTARFTDIGQPQKSMAKMATPMAGASGEATGSPELAMDESSQESMEMLQAMPMLASASFRGEPAAEQLFATSYDELYARMQKSMVVREFELGTPIAGGGDRSNTPTGGMADGAMPGTGSAAAGSAQDTKSEAVYQTNTQLEGVDEADIVKTDGSYLYHYRRDRKTGIPKISIVEAKALKETASIPMDGSYSPNIYLAGQNLVVVEDVAKDRTASLLGDRSDLIIPEYEKKKQRFVPMTQVAVYDLTDKTNPRLAHSFYQSGSYENSRLHDNVVYTVTRQYLSDLPEPAAFLSEQTLPFTVEQAVAKLLPAESIWIGREERPIHQLGYTVLSALDLDNGFTTTKAIAGDCDEMLLTPDSLYLTADLYSDWGGRETGILKFTIDRTNLAYVGDTTVEGYIDNQFALDEYQGNLRIATTSWNDKRNTQNGVYVLDRQLAPLGKVTGLAETEQIYSVRYAGQYAYMVTFRQTDPLFVIDLSDPTAPVVKGELKIPGFSEYLHPIDATTLLGIGQNTREVQGGVRTDGLKLSLFDVSDPTRPTETAQLLIGNTGSTTAALANHKAVLYYPEKQLVGLPAEIYQGNGGAQQVFSGYLLVEIKAATLEIKAKIENSSDAAQLMRTDAGYAIERGAYIGDTLYTLSAQDIRAFDLANNCKQIGLLNYLT